MYAAEKLLSKRWYNTKGVLDSGKHVNQNIDILVKAYLSGANTKTISGLVGTLQNQADKLQRKEDCLLKFTSIDRQNFHVFYNGLCSALLQRYVENLCFRKFQIFCFLELKQKCSL